MSARPQEDTQAAGSLVRIDTQGSCRTVWLNRPEKMNALSAGLVEALIDAVDAAHADGMQALVFRGEGRNLSAGFDFGDVDTQSEGDLVLRFVRIETLLQKIAASPCLTVGLAHGRNFGAGVDLFAACKLRCATPDSSFRMPGLKFGLVLGTRRFGAIVGREKAREILEQARAFPAEEARNIGFVHRLADIAQWPEVTEEAARTAGALDDATRARLYLALDSLQSDADMADLVRSAAEPGLKARVAAYLKAARG